MNYQLYDPRDLDERTRQLIVRDEVDKILDGQMCCICGKPFVGRDEKDNAYVVTVKPMTHAHDYCYEKESGNG